MAPTFSPDGNQVAFAWNRQERLGVNHIYVKLIGADEPVRLTRDEDNDRAPAWSPDGRFIAFLRTLPNDRSGVFLIPAPGGAARKLAEVWSPRDAEAPLLAWHPSGKWLVVLDKDFADQPLALFLLSVETGEKRRLTTPPQRIYLGDVGPAVHLTDVLSCSAGAPTIYFSKSFPNISSRKASRNSSPLGIATRLVRPGLRMGKQSSFVRARTGTAAREADCLNTPGSHSAILSRWQANRFCVEPLGLPRNLGMQ